ncbi:MAG TPA: hypothetical protein VFF30_12680 [Nitrososphaerales archaeon]|nr:hypothetical protein [Nitrososphaerales archaeon]
MSENYNLNRTSIETNTLNNLAETITDVTTGLDPEVLSRWYGIVESEARSLCPTEELRESIRVIQDPVLLMKFELKASKRAIPYVVEAIEDNLAKMPFATRLYFQKFEEIMNKELEKYLRTTYR